MPGEYPVPDTGYATHIIGSNSLIESTWISFRFLPEFWVVCLLRGEVHAVETYYSLDFFSSPMAPAAVYERLLRMAAERFTWDEAFEIVIGEFKTPEDIERIFS